MIPVLGWTAFFAGNVFLERDWDKDKVLMGDQLAALCENPDPILLHLFAEGTRYTAAKHAASVEFAKKSGRPALKHLLVPRTKGFLMAVEKLRGKFPAIYCATMVFRLKDGAVPTLKSMMQRKPVVGEVLLERIPMEDIPIGAEEATNWVHERYIHKDEMIETYFQRTYSVPLPSSTPMYFDHIASYILLLGPSGCSCVYHTFHFWRLECYDWRSVGVANCFGNTENEGLEQC